MTPNPAAQMWDLFEGYPDAYGSEEGGCIYGSAYDAVQQHCFKRIPCGIYPLNEGRVKWGCSDIDVDDYERARLLARTIWLMGLAPFVEVSRSKGYHVWVFAEEWVPAADMRRTLLHAHQACEIPPVEVNPKQEKPGAKGLSNYVRLPYIGFTADDNGRRIVLAGEDRHPLDWWTFYTKASRSRVAAFQLRQWADKYKPPTQHKQRAYVALEADEALIRQLNGWCRKVLAEGPAEWRFEDGAGGRSGALARLAHEVRKSGLPPEAAKAVLVLADDRWEKYTDRANRDEILDDLVRRAYG